MRKLIVLIVPCLCLSLSACFERPPKELPGAEVVHRMLLATALLQSVTIESTVSLKTVSPVSQALLVVTGTLSPAKQQWTLDAGGTVDRGVKNPIIGKIALFSPAAGSAFLRFDHLQVQNGTASKILSGSLLGQWIALQDDLMPPSPRGSATPDPSVIASYASAIRVNSGGLEKDANGNYVYHLAVSIETGALLGSGMDTSSHSAVIGDLTIDPVSFHPLRATWTLRDISTTAGSIDGHIDIRFHSHNTATLRIPVLSGSALRSDVIFTMISEY